MKTLKNKMTWTGTPGHTPEGVSMTVPGDTLPLKHILLRFANGMEAPKGEAMYGDVEDDEHESSDYNQVMNADLVEKQAMLEDRIAFLEVLKTKKEEAIKAKIEAVKNTPETPEE